MTIYNAAITPSRTDTFQIWYVVKDASGNITTKKRIVYTKEGEDNDPPKITIKGENPMALNINEKYVEYNAIVSDEVSGDLTDNVKIDDSELDVSSKGTYYVTYTVADAAGNKAEERRRVVVGGTITDTEKPVIILKGDYIMFINVGSSYSEPGATATDNIDGDISSDIKINADSVKTDVEDTCRVHYTVSDNAGNTAYEIRTVIISKSVVVDNIPPIITVIGSNLISLALGETYEELGATANDNIDGDITSDILINSDSVDVNKEGIYRSPLYSF